MNHLPVLPVLIPLAAGALLLLTHERSASFKRALAGIALLALTLAVGAALIEADSGQRMVYQLGNWPSNIGIVLVLDRLSALMLVLATVLGVIALVHAAGGDDQRQPHFHALLMFQLMGLNGAFLTGDLFNLFVFFEVLLIASYALLVHAADGERLRRATHYMVINLTGSALFLIALGLLFGLVGTLNMADLARKIALAPVENQAIIEVAALLLMTVFAIKGALLPVYLWLPRTYAAATPAVAALFAIMTKVGIYAVYRVHSLIFGADAGALAQLAQPWLLPLGIGTLILAALGALAARELRVLVGYLIVASAGTLFVAFGVGDQSALNAGLFYLIHSTLVVAALFLLADLIATHRPRAGDSLRLADYIQRPDALALVFLILAVAVTALPPLSGFIAKVALLDALAKHPDGAWIWAAVLGSGLLLMVSLARAGSQLFWRPAPEAFRNAAPVPAPSLFTVLPIAALTTAILALSVLADPVLRYTGAAATQLLDTRGYIDDVLGQVPVERAQPAP